MGAVSQGNGKESSEHGRNGPLTIEHVERERIDDVHLLWQRHLLVGDEVGHKLCTLSLP